MNRRPRNLSSASSQPPGTKVDHGSVSPISPHHDLPLVFKYGLYPPITINTSTKDVLAYLFAPPEGSSESNPGGLARLMSPYAAWGELAPKLEDDNFKSEFALDLVEVFFQIVHTRLPLLNPEQFRSRLRLSSRSSPGPTTPDNNNHSNSEKPLHPALAATVIAWGTKFSEHPLLVADRRRPSGQSALSKCVIERARDLAEALKVHRIPNVDHVVVGLLLEPLQSQVEDQPSAFQGFWLRASVHHLVDIGITHKSVITTIASDPEERGTLIFAWWMACICDAYGSMYYRYKPLLDDDDYDIDFYTVDFNGSDSGGQEGGKPSPREQLEFLGYYKAAHSLARTARQMSRQLWKPITDSDGVPLEVLSGFSDALGEWRKDFLSLVGVPSNFEGEWDFVTAVSSCASDAQYHVLWIILFNAIDEFGIKEMNETIRSGLPANTVPNLSDINLAKQKLADEALHGALRIAGLAGVLTTNGYLRLDTAVMHISCIRAGELLARLGRHEVSNCIAALEQYSYAYEEMGEHAVHIRQLYNQYLTGDHEFNHMASHAPKVVVSGHNDQSMIVDDPVRPSSATDAFSHGVYTR